MHLPRHFNWRFSQFKRWYCFGKRGYLTTHKIYLLGIWKGSLSPCAISMRKKTWIQVQLFSFVISNKCDFEFKMCLDDFFTLMYVTCTVSDVHQSHAMSSVKGTYRFTEGICFLAWFSHPTDKLCYFITMNIRHYDSSTL